MGGDREAVCPSSPSHSLREMSKGGGKREMRRWEEKKLFLRPWCLKGSKLSQKMQEIDKITYFNDKWEKWEGKEGGEVPIKSGAGMPT